MLIKTEEFVDGHGIKMCREFFGTDEKNITCTVERPIVEKMPEETFPTDMQDSSMEIQAQILLNQADILAKQQEQDEVLAEILLQQSVKQQENEEVLAAILLNQMGGGEADV
ncbi:MAG: hypothetical protein HFH73_07720 [Lachnospiraceae bacterium]|nr:hypothetical protein [Lachnospiraceae bacterium]